MAEPSAKLIYDGKEIELPVVRGTEDELGIDISKLRAETGLITLDYGFITKRGRTPSRRRTDTAPQHRARRERATPRRHASRP